MLPTPKALALFEDLAASPDLAAVVSLPRRVDEHLAEIRAAARTNELLPLDLAEELARKLHDLLGELGAFAGHDQAAVIGAALYFISNNDELPDTGGVLGLDDDAAIFNHVTRLIGREDLVIDL